MADKKLLSKLNDKDQKFAIDVLIDFIKVCKVDKVDIDIHRDHNSSDNNYIYINKDSWKKLLEKLRSRKLLCISYSRTYYIINYLNQEQHKHKSAKKNSIIETKTFLSDSLLECLINKYNGMTYSDENIIFYNDLDSHLVELPFGAFLLDEYQKRNLNTVLQFRIIHELCHSVIDLTYHKEIYQYTTEVLAFTLSGYFSLLQKKMPSEMITTIWEAKIYETRKTLSVRKGWLDYYNGFVKEFARKMKKASYMAVIDRTESIEFFKRLSKESKTYAKIGKIIRNYDGIN